MCLEYLGQWVSHCLFLCIQFSAIRQSSSNLGSFLFISKDESRLEQNLHVTVNKNEVGVKTNGMCWLSTKMKTKQFEISWILKGREEGRRWSDEWWEARRLGEEKAGHQNRFKMKNCFLINFVNILKYVDNLKNGLRSVCFCFLSFFIFWLHFSSINWTIKITKH